MLMTVDQVAERLNMKVKTIYAWASRGELPGFKLGKMWRFDSSEIEIWLASQRHKPADSEALARQILAPSRTNPDFDRIVQKAIADEAREAYTGRSGRPDRRKGNRKGGGYELG